MAITRQKQKQKRPSLSSDVAIDSSFFLYIMYKTKCLPINPLSFKIKLLIRSLSIFYFMFFSFCVTTWSWMPMNKKFSFDDHVSFLFPISLQCFRNSTAESMSIVLLHGSPCNSLKPHVWFKLMLPYVFQSVFFRWHDIFNSRFMFRWRDFKSISEVISRQLHSILL